ncbi:MAG TPA: hypothetical protein PLQ82_16410, partial [Desulfobacteraceae bacterium]|nr:hypothetical protein [Desulfobacteraceae bacterium]
FSRYPAACLGAAHRQDCGRVVHLQKDRNTECFRCYRLLPVFFLYEQAFTINKLPQGFHVDKQ